MDPTNQPNIPKGVAITLMVAIFLLCALALVYLIVGILYLYMLQKFYIQGSGLSLLNNHDGKVLYGSLVAAFICFAAAACTNNRSPVALTFMLLASIAIIIAVAKMKQLESSAVLMYLLGNGEFTPIDPLKGKETFLKELNIHKVMFGLSIALVVITVVTWFFGMYVAAYPRKDKMIAKLSEVKSRFNGGLNAVGRNELNEVNSLDEVNTKRMYF